MAGFDTKEMMNRAIRYMAEVATQRAAGGWVPPKEQERQQREAMRQEQQQARQVEKQQQAQQKQFISDEKERQRNLEKFNPIKDETGAPMVFYHGTNKPDFSQFKLPGKKGTGGNAIFVSSDPKTAEYFTHNAEGSRIYPVYISANNVFDHQDEEHANALSDFVYANHDKLFPGALYGPETSAAWAKSGDYGILEHPEVKKWMKKQGHDGFYVRERQGGALNIGLFDPSQIKSATGNSGHFDPSNPDITKSEGGQILSKQFPTQYMPNVGRQVMQDGGVPDQPQRQLSPMGFYSAAAERASALQPSGNAVQMVNSLRNLHGVKTEELQNAGLIDQSNNVHPDWAGRGKVTRDELISHLQGQMPQIEERVFGYNKNIPGWEIVNQDGKYMLRRPDGSFHTAPNSDIPATWSNETAAQAALNFNAKDSSSATKYSQYTLPGGENYREVLLKYKDPANARKMEIENAQQARDITPEEIAEHKALLGSAIDYRSPHWRDEPNVLAHIRMSDRIGPNGEKILHIEELQSDWGQKGKKKGFWSEEKQADKIAAREELQQMNKELRDRYKDMLINKMGQTEQVAQARAAQNSPQVIAEMLGFQEIYNNVLDRATVSPHENPPSAPYVTSTEGWTDLALKRVLKEAAEGGYHKVVWTPGEEQAERYDLKNHVSQIFYRPDKEYLTYADIDGGWIDHPDPVTPEKLPEVIGKDAAERLLSQTPDSNDGSYRLRGEDLSFGGEGMKGYYDNIVPKRLQAIAKKHDKNAKVGYTDIMLPAAKRKGSNNPPIQAPGIDITPEMRESILRGQSAYADGGEVEREGFAGGGSPSISDRIFTFAETLPTTEENIEYLKKFGRDVGESAYDLGKRVISGFAKRAEQASERTPPPNVRAGERPVYVEPKREAPPQRRYILPDGRMGSKAELDLSNEMAKERFEEQYATPRVVQENMPSLPTKVDGSAPTRAPFREKLQRQEQQANVDRPVVLPERKGFDWPQVYKDIMSDEPQMEWTKGMTPREQAPPPPPPPSSGGSILGGLGEGQGGHRYVEGGPLELTVGGNRPQIEPRDVYIPSNDTPNPFHFHQTMVAPAPEYEGQVVPIPDTPADRMSEYHLSKLIWPLHQLKSKEGYKAKQGLEDYNPPASAIGERFPNQEDVNFYRDVDAYYGRPEAGYLQQGARGSYYDDLTKMVDRQGGYRRTMTPQESDAFKAAYIAAQRNPIAALGFRPEEFDFSGSPIPQTTAGSVLGTSTRIYADLKFPSVAVHEAIHRGLMEIENEDYNDYKAKIDSLLKEMNDLTKQRYSPEMQNRIFQISNELDRLHENKTDPDIFPPGQIGDPEEKVDEQELFVRSLMYKMFGPVEGYELERQLIKGGVIEEYPPEKLERFMIDNADRIGRLEQRALSMLQERAADRERGPRASGGAVRGEYALGGNPADRLGGGYGTGNIGGGSSISSGGSMAEARAADRASVSGYSNDSGGGSSGGGGGGGRDSSSSNYRSTSSSNRDRLDSDALRPGGNIGAELVKGAVSNKGMFSPSIDMPMQFGMGVRQAGFPTQQTGPMDPRNQGYAEQMAKSAREAYLQSTRPIDPTSSENAYNFREPFVGGISDERIAEIQRQLNEPIGQPMGPVKPQAALPDSAFGRTLIDPTGKYTQDALGQMQVASDGINMLNSPTLAGAFVRAFTPTPTPATPQQQAAIERMYRRDLNTSVPANFATPEGMAQRYGAPGATPLARPGQTSTAYLNAGPSASTGRQDMPVRSTSTAPSPSSNQTPKQNFENAFSAARARGDSVFTWTNPKTGQTMRYTTKLQRKSGGRVPSISEHEQWEYKEK